MQKGKNITQKEDCFKKNNNDYKRNDLSFKSNIRT